MKGFNAFQRFPYRLREEDYEIVPRLLPKVKEVLELITPVHRTTLTINDDDYQKRKLKVIYRENDCNHEIVVNLCRSEDIITYAELLKRGIKVITQLEFVESIRSAKDDSSRMDVYEGDIFMSRKGGQYEWEKCTTQYILCKGDAYYNLLYTKGKGYVRGGQPDYDHENKHNFHVLTFEDQWEKVGNAYLDLSFLIDNDNSKTN